MCVCVFGLNIENMSIRGVSPFRVFPTPFSTSLGLAAPVHLLGVHLGSGLSWLVHRVQYHVRERDVMLIPLAGNSLELE